MLEPHSLLASRVVVSASRLAVFALALLVLGSVGCIDKEKRALEAAKAAIANSEPLISRDTKQVREGMPEGTKILTKNVNADPGSDREGLQRAIQKARAGSKELALSKGTFFIYVDKDGTVLRSQSDPDLPADKSLTKEVPEAKKFFAKDAGMLEMYGSMHGLRGVQNGADLQWLVGMPVIVDDELKGAFLTGWSLRKYAEYLENLARQKLVEQSEDKTKAPPLIYVFMVKGDTAYGGAVTPDVTTAEITKMGLSTKVKSGDFEGRLEVEDRKFVVLAKAAPDMADDMAIAILASAL